jgi:hypothetical protein
MYFRAMPPDADGLPLIGPHARRLGVRVPEDVRPDPAGNVVPGSGGMSVAPDSIWNLPHHRRPRMLGCESTGPAQDHVFFVESPSLNQHGLDARLDPAAPGVHALVEPVRRIMLASFQGALTATRSHWNVGWP